MSTIAQGLELFTLLSALFAATLACFSLWQEQAKNNIKLIEKANIGITIGHILASCILLYALVTHEFSFNYVANYTDSMLPLFYRLTAFWAGQPGSLLFWALMISLCGLAFQFTKGYQDFTPETKQWYWIFYCGIMAFFSLLLTAWSDPFTTTFPAPLEGRGLNPLLQNPGMIIHPPLLFLGYGGFTIPSCLALAQALSKTADQEARWLETSRPFYMTAWLFLTAGIVIGAWWAYMELGWGGYWAWDPVENASLLPWLVGTAALHTMIIEQRRNKLQRVNVFLIALTTVSAFFATYLVRGNVVDSVHAFGDGGVGLALLLFVLFSFVVILFISVVAKRAESAKSLAGIETREGFLVFTSWLFLAIALIILFATLWPLISLMWSDSAIGLDVNFYNTVCLPLFTVLAAMLVLCPYLGWNGGLVDKKNLFLVCFVILVNLVTSFIVGYANPLALVASAVSVGLIASCIIQLIKPSTRAFLPRFAAHGVHLGLAFIVLGVTFSSAYKIEKDVTLNQGQSVVLGNYIVTLNQLYEGEAVNFAFLEAELIVSNADGKVIGSLSPQKRIYHSNPKQSFSEVGTLPGLVNEVYASLYGLENHSKAVLKISINPLVNWIWIGSALMSLFPFLALRAIKRRED